MRVVVAWVLAALLAGEAKAADERPVFQFKAFKAGEDIDLRQLPLEKCKLNDRQNTLDCTFFGEPIAGWNSDVLIYAFNRNRLYALAASLNERAYPDVLDAFKAKYGTPCSSSGAGEFMDFAWCFRTGTLTLTRLVPSAPGKISITYIDDDKPVSKPKVDF